MGTQKPVVFGEELPEDLGGPIAEHHGKAKEKGKSKKEKVEEKIKEKKIKAKSEEPVEVEGVNQEKSDGQEPNDRRDAYSQR